MATSAVHNAEVKGASSGIGTLLLVAIAAFGIIAIAWVYEIYGGLKPCPLCLKQRWAYYFAIPALFAIALFFRDLRHGPGALLLSLVLVAFAANVPSCGLSLGVEWKWWAGPTACSGGGASGDLAVNAGNLLGALEETRVIRCDEAPWRFLGLSFAGWKRDYFFDFFRSLFLCLPAWIQLKRLIQNTFSEQERISNITNLNNCQAKNLFTARFRPGCCRDDSP